MKYVNYILNTLLIGFFLAVGGLFIASVLPIPGQIDMKIVKSGSMEPAIMTGGLVVIQPAEKYAVGDVITFGEDTKTHVPTTHRIMSIASEDGKAVYTTKGDANEEADPAPVYESEVIGRVFFSIPYAGYVLDFARQPLGFALLVAVPAALVIMSELWSLFGELKGRKRREPRESVPVHEQKETPREPLYRYAEPTVDLREFQNPNVLNLRRIRPGDYHRYYE